MKNAAAEHLEYLNGDSDGPSEPDAVDIQPDLEPEPSCFEMLKAVANRIMAYDYTVWFWGDAIAFDGLIEASVLLGNDTPVKFCGRYFDRMLKRPLTWTDHLCPGGALMKLHEMTGREDYRKLAVRLADHLLNEIPRSPVEGVPLYSAEKPMYRHTAYVDTIYHGPAFYGRLQKYDEALHEWQVHCKVLRDARGPFLCHAYDSGYQRTRGYGWGRGNGWALLGMVDTLELLPAEHPGRAAAVEEFANFARDIRQVQDESGFWRTLLHDPEAYLEASTAAFFGAAFLKGIRLGLLTEEYLEPAERAWRAVASRIDELGNFRGVSACTWAGTVKFEDADVYKTLPTEVNVWGQGSALRFIAERIRVKA